MVNGVSFRAGALDSAKDILDQPQAHTRPQNGQGAPTGPEVDTFVKPKKKHGFMKAVVGTVVAAAVIATGLALGKGKFAGWAKTLGGPEATGIKKFGVKALKFAEKAGNAIAEFGGKGLERIKGMFGKGAEAGEAVA